jgi:hypothetical protein
MSAAGPVSILRRRTMILAAALLAVTAAPASVGAADPLYFNVTMHLCFVSGHAIGGPVTVSVLSPDGVSKGTESGITPDVDGNWRTRQCFADGIEAGDRISARFGSTSRTFVVPPLNATANRVSNVVRGNGPPNSTVKVTISRCEVVNVFCTAGAPSTLPTDASGRFSRTFAAEDPSGGDGVAAVWTSPLLDTVTQALTFPFVTVSLGRSAIYGYGKPDGFVTTTLMSAAGAIRGKARGIGDHRYGSFSGFFTAPNASVVYVRARDKVSSTVASDASFRVPQATVSGVSATGIISGRCLPSRTVLVYAFDPTYTRTPYNVLTTVTAGADGRFSWDSSTSPFVLTVGDRVEMTCATPAGDGISRQATAS